MENLSPKYIKKKKLILEALKRLLSNNVYSNISFDDVAEEAKMSKGGIRHYFPTKESLFIDLIELFFNEIEKDQIIIIKEASLSKDRALLSTMYGFENFLLRSENIKIFINIMLYSFEEPKIKDIARLFLRKHLELLKDIYKDISVEQINNLELDVVSRYTQIILLTMGLFQIIDPIEIDVPTLINKILKLIN